MSLWAHDVCGELKGLKKKKIWNNTLSNIFRRFESPEIAGGKRRNHVWDTIKKIWNVLSSSKRDMKCTVSWKCEIFFVPKLESFEVESVLASTSWNSFIFILIPLLHHWLWIAIKNLEKKIQAPYYGIEYRLWEYQDWYKFDVNTYRVKVQEYW